MKKLFVILAGVMMMLCLVACEEKASGVKDVTEPSTTVGAPETTTAAAATAKADAEGEEMGGEENAGGAEDNGGIEQGE